MGRPSALLRYRGNQHQQESKELPFYTLAFASMCCCHILWEFHSFMVGWSLDGNHRLCWPLPWPCMVWSSICDPRSCCVHLGHHWIAHKHYVKEFDSLYSKPSQISWHNLWKNDRKDLAKCVRTCVKGIVLGEASGKCLGLTKLHRNLHGIKSFCWPSFNASVYLSLGSCPAPVGVKG